MPWLWSPVVLSALLMMDRHDCYKVFTIFEILLLYILLYILYILLHILYLGFRRSVPVWALFKNTVFIGNKTPESRQ